MAFTVSGFQKKLVGHEEKHSAVEDVVRTIRNTIHCISVLVCWMSKQHIGYPKIAATLTPSRNQPRLTKPTEQLVRIAIKAHLPHIAAYLKGSYALSL